MVRHSTIGCSNFYIYAALLALGLGTHHAGMTMDDRRLTEELYLGGQIRTLAATSVNTVHSVDASACADYRYRQPDFGRWREFA